MNWEQRGREGEEIGTEGGRYREKLGEGRGREGKDDACVVGSFSVLRVGSSRGQG